MAFCLAIVLAADGTPFAMTENWENEQEARDYFAGSNEELVSWQEVKLDKREQVHAPILEALIQIDPFAINALIGRAYEIGLGANRRKA